MNAREQLDSKLAEAKQAQEVEQRWGKLFALGLAVWSGLVVPPLYIWSEVIPWGAAVTIYAAGVAALVAWTWVRASR